jgi:HAD superfamily hydrolase (TIGR01509 family)
MIPVNIVEMINIQSVIFDMDGTIVDTEPAAVLAVKECFSDIGIKLDAQDAQYVVGRTWSSSFEYLSKKYNPKPSREELATEIKSRYRKKIRSNLISIPGCVETISQLASKYKIGLVSGSDREDILWILEKLGVQKYFRILLGAQDYQQSKPSPEGYLKAFSLLQIPPQHGLIFEDSGPGIQAAKTAGAWVVAIQTANRFGHDQSAAHLQIPDFKGIDPDWVTNLTKKVNNSLKK